MAWVAAAPFEGVFAEWLRRFKYPAPGLAGLDPSAEAVAGALIRRAAALAPGPPPQAVVAVPPHPRRLRARGFHAAGVLAAIAARAVGAPARPDGLVRRRDTPSQTGLSRRARRRNVAGAFAAGRRPLPARIWLVDDVTTTGATLAAAAHAARRAGAREVVGVCAARTPG